MAQTRSEEHRLLDKDEHQLVTRAHHPALREMGDGEVDELVKRLRERRDRARDIAGRQRRQIRGKSALTGARSVSDDTGTREKWALLAAALKRVSKENGRRKAHRVINVENATRRVEV